MGYKKIEDRKQRKRSKNKIVVTTMLVLVTSILFFLLPFPFNETETNVGDILSEEAQELLDYVPSKQPNESGKVYADSIKPDSGIWTLYARLVMGGKDIEEDAKATGQVKLLGQGGVSADFPFTDISKNGNDLTGDNSGTHLSAFLATYSYYGYIETVSGNAIASGVSSFLGGLGRAVGSLIAGIALGISAIAEAINNVLATFFMSLNPLALLGFGDSTSVSNPISDAITSLLSNLGLNNAFFKSITALAMVIFTAIMAIKVISMLSSNGVSKGVMEPVKKWFVRILVLGVVLPIMYSFMAVIIEQVQQSKDDGELTTSVVSGYIINTRLWASTQNLAPDSRLGSGVIPNATINSDPKFIDTDYEPSRQKKLIEKINQTSYASYGGSLQPDAVGMALIKEWSGNDTFNINTYAGDVNIAKNDAFMKTIPAVNPLANEGIDEPTDLSGYIWSSDQNVIDGNRLPNGKGNETEFDATAKWGVADNATFSTQSVALLLQSEISSSGTKFYSYNLAPSGVQGAAKNMSTVKTEWRTASLVGHGALGKFGAWLAMVSESLVQAVYYLACAWVLFTISLVDILKRMFRRIFEVAVFASIPASAGLLAISLALIVVAVMAMSLPSVLISVSRAFATTAVGLLPSSFLIDGLQNMITALFTLGTCWLIAIPSKKRDITIIKTIMSLPLELAKGLDKRASLVMGGRNDAVRIADGIAQGMNSKNGNDKGANNPYYQGNGDGNGMKDVVAGAFAGAGATKLADKIGNMGESEGKNANNYKDQTAKSRDFVDQYKDNKPTDHLGRLVDEDGNLVDTDGKKILEGYGMDGDGRYLDERGRLVDKDGNLIDTDGNLIEPEKSSLVDHDNKNFEKKLYGMNVDGDRVDDLGRLVDENGNLLDKDGKKLLSGEYGMDGEGRLVDEKGRLVDEDGNLVDEDGNVMDENELGYSVGGLRVNEDGIIEEEESAKDKISSVTSEGYGEYNGEESLEKETEGKSEPKKENDLRSDERDLPVMPNTGGTESDFVNNEGQSTKSAKEVLRASKKPKEPITKEKEKNKDKNKEKGNNSTSPLMRKFATGTKNTVKKVDKALAESPKGSLASMTYATKETVTTSAKSIIKGGKIISGKKENENEDNEKTK